MEEIQLYPKEGNNGKFGYVNEKDEWIIAPQFDDAEDFSEGLACVVVNDKVGFIRTDGTFLVEPKFEYTIFKGSFRNGVARIKYDNKYGIITNDGSYLIEPIFERLGNFYEGFASVKDNSKWGFIRKDGSYLVAPKFDSVSDYRDGISIITIDGKYGYLKKDGTYLVEPKFDIACYFEDGFAEVRWNGIVGKIDTEGNFYDKEGNLLQTSMVDDSQKDSLKASSSKKVDWEERHFQICLSLLSRTHLHSYHHNTISTKEVDPRQIIRKADEMMEELKKHYAEKFK